MSRLIITPVTMKPLSENSLRSKSQGCIMTQVPTLFHQLGTWILLLLLSSLIRVQGEDFTITTNNGAVSILEYKGPGGAVIIPQTINGLPVVTVEDNAFASRSSLESIVIPNTISNIGSYAFKGCFRLTNAVLGAGVKTIGTEAFYSCKALTDLVLPDSVVRIGSSAFHYCSGLTNFSLGASVADIGGYAFSFCEFTEITIPSCVTNIGYSAFSPCRRLAGVTIYATNLSRIGDGVFSSCTSLASLTVPASVTNIGNAFAGCSSFREIIVAPQNPVYSSFDGVLFNKDRTELIFCPPAKLGSYVTPDTVTSIADYAFRWSTLDSIRLSDNVRTIGSKAFDSCEELTNLVLGNYVLSIGDSAFIGCDRLLSVTIPDTVTNIGTSAFAYCYGLTEVYWRGNAPVLDFHGFTNSFPTVFYLPGTTGWENTFADRPTAIWRPRIQLSDNRFGSETNQFGFNIAWARGMQVAIEICTNLAGNPWFPLETNTLTSDQFYFTDPRWTNVPTRFYRLRWP